MDINIEVHKLLECGGTGEGVVVLELFERMLKKALEDYVLKKDFLLLAERTERLERIVASKPWEAEFVMKYDGTNSIRLDEVLSEFQLFTITDRSAGGPNSDGHKRTIAVYVITDGGESILLPWGKYGEVNNKSAEALRAAGIDYIPAGLYYLDSEGILQCNIQKDVHFKIANLPVPIE